MLAEMGRVLGIGVVVRSIDRAAPVTVQAILVVGRHSREVTVTGPTEDEAWRALAAAAAAWRREDGHYWELWAAGGG